MKYITLVDTIENISNTNLIQKITPKQIHEANVYANEFIESYTKNGQILKCNVPKIVVLYDLLSERFKCIPKDAMTMYMMLTTLYDMGDQVHYERFTTLMDTEPQFVRDLTSRHRATLIKADLRSSDDFSGLDYYIRVFDLHRFDPANFVAVRETLEYEYWIKSKGKRDFFKFQSIVFDLLERMDHIYEISKGRFDVDKAWRYIFQYHIQSDGMCHYGRQCKNNAVFDSLFSIYSPDNINKRKGIKTEYKAPPPKQPIKPKPMVNSRLEFMGLPSNFNKKQLKKRFRKLAIKYHPDKGGDPVKFLYLKECYDALLKL